jgi:signal transduction histidine kinase
MPKSILTRIAIIMAVMFIGSSAIFYNLLERYYHEENIKKIDQLLIYNLAIQHYISKYQRPALEELMYEHNVSGDYFNPFLLSSTFIAQQINKSYEYISHAYHFPKHEHDPDHSPWDLPETLIHHDNLAKELLKAQSQQDTLFLHHVAEKPEHEHMIFKQLSDNPTNPNNRADAYEQEILTMFREQNLSHYVEDVEKDGVPYTFYALAPARNKAECMHCHSTPEIAPRDIIDIYGENGFGEKVGDLRSLTAVYTPIHRDHDESTKFFLLIEGLMLIVFSIIFYIIYHYTKKIKQKDELIAKQSQFAAMGEMIGMIAHQWRQPITGIGMAADNMKLDIELQTVDEKVWGDNLNMITNQIHYLSKTIDDFRNFFRPNQQPVETHINQLVNDALQIIAKSLENNNISIDYHFATVPPVKTFKNELLQVVLNLLKNSIDAYNENAIEERPIMIAVRDLPESVELTFSDRAGGIDTKIMEKIFDPYFSTKDEKTGTGLGLYMSKLIVEDHLQGTISVDSEKESTTFVITLPKEFTHIGASNGN